MWLQLDYIAIRSKYLLLNFNESITKIHICKVLSVTMFCISQRHDARTKSLSFKRKKNMWKYHRYRIVMKKYIMDEYIMDESVKNNSEIKAMKEFIARSRLQSAAWEETPAVKRSNSWKGAERHTFAITLSTEYWSVLCNSFTRWQLIVLVWDGKTIWTFNSVRHLLLNGRHSV